MGRYHSFDPVPVAPAAALPRGACDSHFHVFGERSRYPVLQGVEHDMPEATVTAALKMHAALGFQRGVIVASTVNGSDHQVVLDALAIAGSGYRACALHTVLDEKPETYLQTLHEAGVRGARFNLLKMLNKVPSPERMRRAIARIRELGWYCKVQPDYHEPLESLAPFEQADCPVLIDHLGRANATEGADGPIATKVKGLLQRGNFWLLLSNAYKVSRTGPPWGDMIPVLRGFIEAAPERVVWATDWPHTFHELPAPNDGELLNLLLRATDEEERRRILVDNPARLFGFGAA